ncbi:MAG: DUF1553 domain-containing protein [Verrucomicrobiota bacterium]
MRNLLLIFTAISVALPQLRANEGMQFFESKIRPLLIKSCYECHSEEAGKRKGGLWIDRKAGWEIGGDSGPALIPGDTEGSLMVEMIRYADPDLAMPPKKKLSDQEIAHLEQWIAMGAPDPRTKEGVVAESSIDLEKGRQFWSFQPISDPPRPSIEDPSWPSAELDYFVAAKREAANLEPAPDASEDALFRRMTIALTGLPPTVEDQAEFRSGEVSIEEVVDRLLASHAFAERWGRHWLDIARYADTSGGGRAMPLPDAWRFRDYVIESFHQDKPLDQLIREHIAGDLLPAKTREQEVAQLTGTGFLVLGPHNYENQDKDLLDLEIADEQVDTIGRAFLGMTIGCARCHDHKFDPIPTKDYYAMAGIFLSSKTVVHSNVSKWYTENYPPTPEQSVALAAYAKQEDTLQGRIDDTKRQLRGLGQMDVSQKGNQVSKGELGGIVVDDEEAELVGKWMKSTSQHRWVDAGYAHDLNTGKGTKTATFRPNVDKAGHYQVRIAYSQGSNRPNNTPVTIHHADGEIELAVDQQKRPPFDNLFLELGTFRFEAGTEGFVRISNRGTNGHVIIDAVQLLPEGSQSGMRKAKAEVDLPIPHDGEKIAALELRQKELNAELKRLQKKKPKLPSLMCVGEASDPADTPVRIRGVARNFGPPAPRGFLQVAMRPEQLPEIDSGSGRLELAHWVASSENPLTARVLANRIWLKLFGTGIVTSPDNFGTTGNLPTHPELLDHLATRLIKNQWSTKALVREIVLSRTWQMATAPKDPSDPGNELYHHFPLQRIDAETLRDSLLAISGTLDSSAGGPSLPSGFRSEFGYQFKSLKRSVYIPAFRNTMHEIFGKFDFANPNFVVGQRSQSTIPTQALYLTNSPFVHEQSRLAAERLAQDEPQSSDARLFLAYQRILGRAPTAPEMELSNRFLSAHEDELEAWSGLVRGLFSCVDFLYIR